MRAVTVTTQWTPECRGPKDDRGPHVNALSDEHRLRFYELLAHGLTISIRVVLWDDDTRSDAEKANAVGCINEFLHRITSRIAVTRRNLHEWSESDIWEEIRRWVAQDRSIAGDVGWAIRNNLEAISLDQRPT